MDKIKFKIKRTFWGSVWYCFINELLPFLFFTLVLLDVIKTKDILFLLIGLLLFLFMFIGIWRWNAVIFKGDRMIIHYGFLCPYINVDVSNVTNVHYKDKKEEIYSSLFGVNTPFEKREETVCFVSKKKSFFYIATTEPEKFYALLKAREVPE